MNAEASGITVVGSDVYAGGSYYNGTYREAVIWKNGTPTALTDETSDAAVSRITSAGSDVYAVGQVIPLGKQPVATLWKNGVPTSLPDGGMGSFAADVAVSGTDVYVCGYVSTNNGGLFGAYAAIWRNGVLSYLGGQYVSNALSVAVSGRDVYVAGSAHIVPGTTFGNPVYWKNGTMVQLSTEDGMGQSIVVSGSDVYVGGAVELVSQIPGGLSDLEKATLWKDGNAADWSNSSQRSAITGLAVAGGSVYASGLVATGQGLQGGYWKDDVLIGLPPGSVVSEAIVVTQQ